MGHHQRQSPAHVACLLHVAGLLHGGSYKYTSLPLGSEKLITYYVRYHRRLRQREPLQPTRHVLCASYVETGSCPWFKIQGPSARSVAPTPVWLQREIMDVIVVVDGAQAGDAPQDDLTPDLWVLVWQWLSEEGDKRNFAATCRCARRRCACCIAYIGHTRKAGQAGPRCRAASSSAVRT